MGEHVVHPFHSAASQSSIITCPLQRAFGVMMPHLAACTFFCRACPCSITASFRLFKMMRSNSTVLKMKSPWHEWFYRALTPGKHYLDYFVNSTGGSGSVVRRPGQGWPGQRKGQAWEGVSVCCLLSEPCVLPNPCDFFSWTPTRMPLPHVPMRRRCVPPH